MMDEENNFAEVVVLSKSRHHDGWVAELKRTPTTQKLLPSEDKPKKLVLSGLEKYLLALTGILFCSVIVAVILLCVQGRSKADAFTNETSSVCTSSHCVATAARLLKNMNMSVDPCDNFFEFACGGFIHNNIIPDDQSSVQNLDTLYSELQMTLKSLLEAPVQASDMNAVNKAKNFYGSCMDQALIEDAQDTPLRELIDKLGGWPLLDKNQSSLSTSIFDLTAKVKKELNVIVLSDINVDIDVLDSTVHVTQVMQPAYLGMVDRGFYLSGASDSVLGEYREYIKALSRLLDARNYTLAEAEVQEIVDFEISLAEISSAESERYHRSADQSRTTLNDLNLQFDSHLDLKSYVMGVMPFKMNLSEQIVIYDLDYFEKLSQLLTNTSQRTVVNYIIWRVIMDYAYELSSQYEFLDFQFQKILYGLKQLEPRWKKCVQYCNTQLSPILGHMFIESKFKRDSLEKAQELIADVKAAFVEQITSLSWMEHETKVKSIEKLNAIHQQIGYPDYLSNETVVDYMFKKLVINKNHPYFDNLLNVVSFDLEMKMRLLQKSVSQNDWSEPVTVINAFYSFSKNSIVFPAPIWQLPFFSIDQPSAVNYGSIGVVIGHEIIHGFDSSGSLFDQFGNKKQWWDNHTIKAFQERSECMSDQYSQYTVEQVNMTVDGHLTLGENIADNGGLRQAYWAYNNHMDKRSKEKCLPGLKLTNKQLFFLSYAQIWCNKVRDEELIFEMRTAEHSPAPIRVFGPLSNFDEFSNAFECNSDSRMNPKNRCLVW